MAPAEKATQIIIGAIIKLGSRPIHKGRALENREFTP